MEQAAKPNSRDDTLYQVDRAGQSNMNRKAPWTKDVQYFKYVKISTLALLKMANHAMAGEHIEVMGMVHGKIEEHTFVVMDAFATPVQGTETRVNAQADSYEYICNYHELSGHCGFSENVVGWYHSHPGYGCWLSGIDVDTQMSQQEFCDPNVAIVIDHLRTSANGQIEIGAFRTYPENYKPLQMDSRHYQSIPLAKIEDYGVHSNRYYRLEVSFFCSSVSSGILEILWSKNWANTFAGGNTTANQKYMTNRLNDLTAKIRDITCTAAATTANDDEDKSKTKKLLPDNKKLLANVRNIDQDLCCFVGETVNSALEEQLKRDVFKALARARHVASTASIGQPPFSSSSN